MPFENGTEEENNETVRIVKKHADKPPFRKLYIVIGAVVLAAALLVIAGVLIYNRITAPYIAYKVVYTEDLVTGEGIDFVPYADGYIRVTRDGAEAVDSDGLRLWNVSYSMNNPYVVVSGKYASIADIGGTFCYVTDGSGTLSKVELPCRVEEIECSLAGVTAIRMNDGSDDYIRLVAVDGTRVAEIKTVEAKDGFPVDISLSADGKKLVTSYLVINGDKSEGWITFYNFGNVGKNHVNNITGIFKYETVVPAVKFIGKNNVCAFFDQELKFFSVSEVPEEKVTRTFDTYLIGVYPSDTGVIAMQSSKTDGILSHTTAFDAAGNVIFEGSSGNELKGAMFFGKNLMFYNEYACQILDRNGGVVFNGNFNGARVFKIVPSGGRDKMLLFEDGKISTIRLTKDNK